MTCATPRARPTSGSIVGATCILAILYGGRDILQPLALAVIASLAIAPLVRSLVRLGLARLPAILLALAAIGTCATATAIMLVSQLMSICAELPRYHAVIRHKAEQARALLAAPFAHVEAGLGGVTPLAPDAAPQLLAGGAGTLPQLLGLAWGPLGAAALVLVLLLFILLEQETLQDRLIRLSGGREIGRTLGALTDATRGVSRFFFSQFLLNAVFAAAMSLALSLLGLPHALLWGTLAGVLRFIPYLGALASGAAIALFAAAVDPGWGLALYCAAAFASLESMVAHFVEPKIYGHSTGLTPLAVVVSALFWGSLWGPVGLLISTPLTVCLVVAGRHVRALEPLAVLFGQAPDVTAAQRFYQRSLAGETGAIVRDGDAFLRRAAFARYCDHILLPGLELAADERHSGRIDAGQQSLIRRTVAEVADALAPDAPPRWRWLRGRPTSLLDTNIGAHLRRQREARLGRWQGPLDVPLHSIVLCAGLATERDDLLGELLARALREAGIDARSLPLPLPYEEHEPERADLVSAVFLPFPLDDSRAAWLEAVAGLRALLPHALVATILPPRSGVAPWQAEIASRVDMVLRSYEEGMAFAASLRTGAQ